MGNDLHEWERPLKVIVDGEVTVIGGPAAARNLLLMDWPNERTNLHKTASEACLAAMEGVDPEVAWMAFMEAAIEAGIYAD